MSEDVKNLLGGPCSREVRVIPLGDGYYIIMIGAYLRFIGQLA